jgi:putative ABC transport system ATP-binding protein
MLTEQRSGLSLDISALEVRFPGLTEPALAIETFHLPQGEHLAVAGASGSGKSTLINAITGLEGVRTGQVSWNGEAFSSAMRFEPAILGWLCRISISFRAFRPLPMFCYLQN